MNVCLRVKAWEISNETEKVAVKGTEKVAVKYF